MNQMEIRNLQTGYGKTSIVKDISFWLKSGEILGLVGASGSGKSTIFHSLLGVREDLSMMGGEILFGGVEYLTLAKSQKAKLLGAEIAAVFQHASFMLVPNRSIRSQFEELGKKLGMNASYVKERAIAIFSSLQFHEAERIYSSFPYELSGGQKQRVGIALALLPNPKVLLCDEPTSALDAKTTHEIMQVLRMQKEAGMAILLITHNLKLAGTLCDRIIVLRKGEIVEAGSADQIMCNPVDAYTKKLIASVPVAGAGNQENSFALKPVLEVRGLTKTFGFGASAKEALKDVSFTLKKGEILGIIGESGSGKSTLLKLIAGIIGANSGEVLLEQKRVKDYKRDLYKIMQMIFQDAKSSFNPKKTIGSSLDETKAHLCSENTDNCDLLEMVGLNPEYEFKYPNQLSGGECQRAAIARAFSVMPKLLLCDEMTSALDVMVQKDIVQLLIHLSRIHDVSAIFVTHDLPLASGFCDRLLIMKDGKIVEEGTVQDILTAPRSHYTKELVELML